MIARVFEQLVVQILLSQRHQLLRGYHQRGRTDAAWGPPCPVRAATCTSGCIHNECGTVAEQHVKPRRGLCALGPTASKIEVEGEHADREVGADCRE